VQARVYSIKIKDGCNIIEISQKETFAAIIIAVDVANSLYFREISRIDGIKANNLINNIFKLI